MISTFFLIFKASLFWVSFIIITTALSPICIFLRFFGYKASFMTAKFWAYLTIKLLKILCGINYKIKNGFTTKNFLYFSKHQSTWETIFYLLVIEKPIFIVKKELMYIPFFGWCLYLLNNISINRSAGLKSLNKMIIESKKALEKGFSIIVFPEGTRAKFGVKTSLKNGSFIMAKSLNCPIIPITHDSGKCWPKHSYIKFPGIINLVVGKEQYLDNKSLEDFKLEIERWMDSEIKKI